MKYRLPIYFERLEDGSWTYSLEAEPVGSGWSPAATLTGTMAHVFQTNDGIITGAQPAHEHLIADCQQFGTAIEDPSAAPPKG